MEKLISYEMDGVRRILACMVFLFVFSVGYATCEKEIRDFYVTYMSTLNEGADRYVTDSILDTHITEGVREQLGEYVEKTDADPILRAQDVCDYGIQSLQVAALPEKGWYMVSYKWDKNGDYIKIPLKVCDCGHDFQIVYITPEWLGEEYGDRLLKE